MCLAADLGAPLHSTFPSSCCPSQGAPPAGTPPPRSTHLHHPVHHPVAYPCGPSDSAAQLTPSQSAMRRLGWCFWGSKPPLVAPVAAACSPRAHEHPPPPRLAVRPGTGLPGKAPRAPDSLCFAPSRAPALECGAPRAPFRPFHHDCRGTASHAASPSPCPLPPVAHSHHHHFPFSSGPSSTTTPLPRRRAASPPSESATPQAEHVAPRRPLAGGPPPGESAMPRAEHIARRPGGPSRFPFCFHSTPRSTHLTFTPAYRPTRPP